MQSRVFGHSCWEMMPMAWLFFCWIQGRMTMGDVTDRPLEDSTDVVDGGRDEERGGHGDGERGCSEGKGG
jgi:hypothetical protein